MRYTSDVLSARYPIFGYWYFISIQPKVDRFAAVGSFVAARRSRLWCAGHLFVGRGETVCSRKVIGCIRIRCCSLCSYLFCASHACNFCAVCCRNLRVGMRNIREMPCIVRLFGIFNSDIPKSESIRGLDGIRYAYRTALQIQVRYRMLCSLYFYKRDSLSAQTDQGG